jgi:hypothetical protein
MSLKIGQLKTDEKKVKDGVWVEFADGFDVKLAPNQNKKYIEFLRKRASTKMRGYRSGFAEKEDIDPYMNEAMARHIILDWRGLFDDDEETEIPYTWEVALDLLEKSIPFYSFVIEESNRMSHFQAGYVEGQVKNLSASSNGKSNTENSKVVSGASTSKEKTRR